MDPDKKSGKIKKKKKFFFRKNGNKRSQSHKKPGILAKNGKLTSLCIIRFQDN